MLGNDFLFKFTLKMHSLRKTSVLSRLDLNQNRHFVEPDLGPNCLQKLTAVGTSMQRIYSGFNMKTVNFPTLLMR